MADRTTNVSLQVEYVDSLNKRRTTNLAGMVEYYDPINKRRTTNLALMVEYTTVTSVADKFGPKIQIMC